MRRPLALTLGFLTLAVLAACLLSVTATLWREPYRLQWDFHTYYYASAAQAQGLDPYDAANISKVSNKHWTPAFLYPPLTLPLFSLFRAVDYTAAVKVWLLLKLALVAGLLAIWHRGFARLAPLAVFGAYLCFAFGATFYWDLKAGNVSILEQFLLWSAFWCLLRDRPWGFCGLLLAASLFKLTFVAFLPLLLLFDVRRKWLWMASTALGLAVYLVANRLLEPVLFAEYVRQAVTMDDLGSRYNAGTLAFLKDLFGGAAAGPAPLVVYVALAIALLAFVAWRLRPALPALAADRPLAICLACALYAVLMPRMKSYSFIVLVLPAFLVVTRSLRSRSLAVAGLALLALPVRAPFALPVPAAFADGTVGAKLKDYYLLFLAWLVLGLYVRHVRRAAAAVRADR